MKVTNEGKLGFGSLVSGLGGSPEIPEGEVPADCCDDTPRPDRAENGPIMIGIDPGNLTLVQSNAGTFSGGIPTALDFGATPTPGNLMTCHVTERHTPGTPRTGPSGWTKVDDVAPTGADPETTLWYRIAGVSEPVTVTVGGPINGRRMSIAEYEGPASLVDTAVVTNGSSATSHPSGNVTVGGPSVLVGVSTTDDFGAPGGSNPTYTDAASFTTIDSGLVAGAVSPASIHSYRTVAAGTYGYTPTTDYAGRWGTILAGFEADAAASWIGGGPQITDGDDATFIRIDGPNVVRVDLGAPFKIARTRIRLGTETAGARSYVIAGATLADFSDAVDLVTINFTATGSYTAQDVNATWAATNEYQYYQLTGDDESRDVYTWELYEADAVSPAQVAAIEAEIEDHIADPTDAHDASAVSVSPTVLGESDVQAALEALEAAGGGGSLPWYNVVTDGSCVGDGVTDDTVALQAAIDTVTASGTQSATLYFPPGIYLIGGALQSTGTMNGQILLPFMSPTGDAQINVRFLGAARPPTNLLGDTGPDPSGYSIIKSTLTGASGTAACISGGNATNNIHVSIEDLICIAPDNPTFTFWNLAYTQGGGVRDLLIYVAPYWTPPISQPTHSNAYGIKFPQATYSAYTYADGVTVVGFYTGILHGELGLARGYCVGICIVGVELPAMPHATKILSYQMTGCTYGIKVTGALACDIDFYDAEHFTNPPHTEGWTVTVYDLNDASNLLTGHIRWWGVQAAVGPDHVFNVNGGTNALYEEIGEPPAGASVSFATPAIVLGTAAAAGAASTAIRSDSTIVAFDATVPVTQAFGDAAATGSAAVAARRDHKHGMPTTPSGAAHYLVIASSHSTPLVFGDLVQSSAGDDLIYTT